MSQPNRSSTHIDKVATDWSLAQFQDPGVFVGGTILPTRPVSKQSDKYFVYDSAAFVRDDVKLRAAGTESNGTGFSVSNDSYYCEKYSVHVDLSEDEIAEADAPLDLERDAAFLIAQQMLLKRERLVAGAIFKTGVWGLDVDGASTTKWSDYALSDPIAHVDSALRVALLSSLNTPSTLILGLDVFNALKNHPDFNRNTSATTTANASTMASLLGVDRIVVPKAIYNPSGEGKAAANTFVFDPKSALLMSNPPAVGLRTPCAAACFAWTGAPHLPRPNGVVTRRLEMPETQSVRIESDLTLDVKVCGPSMGVYFSDIVA